MAVASDFHRAFLLPPEAEAHRKYAVVTVIVLPKRAFVKTES